MNKIMLDLETLSTSSNAMIMSIGAVVFDETGLSAEFHRKINIELDNQCGAEISASTVCWWAQQSEQAREIFINSVDEFLPTLMDFSAFLDHYAPNAEIFGNGADFDNVILANAYRRAGLIQPWGKYKNRCYRTLKNLAPQLKIARSGTHHNALDDARSQAEHAIALLNHLGGW